MDQELYMVFLRWNGGTDVFLQVADEFSTRRMVKALTAFVDSSTRMSTPLREGWTVVVKDPQTRKELNFSDPVSLVAQEA